MAVTLTERPPASTKDDHELVAALRNGDERAFAELYLRYYDRIVVYVRGMVRDHARAEDVTHDVFLSALRRMRETDRTIAFKPWIYEIARNACIDQFRRARRTEEVSLEADAGLRPADIGRLASPERTPDAAVDQRQQISNLQGAFGGLSESHHEILVLRELEGLSYAEIGDRMGLSRPSVESLLFRARRRLGEEYEDLASGSRCVRTREVIARAADHRLGAGERRRLSRHLAACPHCRHQARLEELDEALVERTRPVGRRIAALLPLPVWLRRGPGRHPDRVTALGDHAGVALPNWCATVLQALEPAAGGVARALAAGGAVAVTSLGAGAATQALSVPSPVPVTSSPVPRSAPAPRPARHARPTAARHARAAHRAPATATRKHVRVRRAHAPRPVVSGGRRTPAPARSNRAVGPVRAPRVSTRRAKPRQAPVAPTRFAAPTLPVRPPALPAPVLRLRVPKTPGPTLPAVSVRFAGPVGPVGVMVGGASHGAPRPLVAQTVRVATGPVA